MGRVVITHSTYIEGLIPILKKLASNEKIKTVTPAIITKVRGRSSKIIIFEICKKSENYFFS